MDKINRRDFLKSNAAWTALAGAGCVSVSSKPYAEEGDGFTWAYDTRRGLGIQGPGLVEPLHIWVAADTHFALRDARDDAHADYYKRMGAWGAAKEPFERMLAAAKKAKIDLLVLAGDIISFPTLANVEYVKSQLDACGVPWLYVAGNHDWHFEGVPGSDIAQRAEWTASRLTPLYQGANPLMASRKVKGVRFVMIDNSVYHILPEQVAFLKAELEKGDPTCVVMHIPFWHPGWSVTTCACPTWGAATDPYWQIERRERWAEKLMPSTFEFREALLSAPNAIGVFAGHIHELQIASECGKGMFTAPGNGKGAFLDVRFG